MAGTIFGIEGFIVTFFLLQPKKAIINDINDVLLGGLMPTEKAFICLANSHRESGLCIAGKEISLDYQKTNNATILDWFRPIGASTPPLSKSFSNIKIGDIIHCYIDSHSPSQIQPENHILSTPHILETKRHFSKQSFDSLLDTPSTLWECGCQSSAGMNNRVRADTITQNLQSLYFIKITNYTISKELVYEKDKLKLEFTYNSETYKLSITTNTLNYYWNTLQSNSSTDVIGSAYITLSLGQPYTDGYCYKLVAGYEPI